MVINCLVGDLHSLSALVYLFIYFFSIASDAIIDLLLSLDNVLATSEQFLLGRWINTARAHGTTAAEEDLYEYNARNQITLWGPRGEVGTAKYVYGNGSSSEGEEEWPREKLQGRGRDGEEEKGQEGVLYLLALLGPSRDTHAGNYENYEALEWVHILYCTQSQSTIVQQHKQTLYGYIAYN